MNREELAARIFAHFVWADDFDLEPSLCFKQADRFLAAAKHQQPYPELCQHRWGTALGISGFTCIRCGAKKEVEAEPCQAREWWLYKNKDGLMRVAVSDNPIPWNDSIELVCKVREVIE